MSEMSRALRTCLETDNGKYQVDHAYTRNMLHFILHPSLSCTLLVLPFSFFIIYHFIFIKSFIFESRVRVMTVQLRHILETASIYVCLFLTFQCLEPTHPRVTV